MAQEVIIRRAGLEDAAVLVAFNRAMAQETEGKDLVPEVIAAGVKNLLENVNLGFYLVAERSDEVIGSLMITTEWSDWRNGIFWWVQSVYVRPDFRRQGVYRRLYQFVQTLAQQDPHVCGFRLYVERENRIAQQTYRSLGMEETAYRVFEDLKSGSSD
ncbi:MAG TPA: GNAT family N-acetyltransferase [Trichocoleus sp.]|jgi:ribosomal protein S18 acetylase RimI-like enzyme